MYATFPELVTAYTASLRDRPCYSGLLSMAKQWIDRLTTTPTRAELLARQRAICQGHYQAGASKANKELTLIRAACRWGLYQERWSGGDPTVGIKKWKTPARTRTSKFEELHQMRDYFLACDATDATVTNAEIRDRALFGLMLFTGCRPSEARTTGLDAITPYGRMGCWRKGKTKNGRPQELPLPTQYMPWLAAWKAIRPARPNPSLFPGTTVGAPLTHDAVQHRWDAICTQLGIHGLWIYDLRRTLTCTLGNELHVDDHTIRAIINHYEGSALGHYYFKSFDSLTKPIQAYADWFSTLTNEERTGARDATDPVTPTPPVVAMRAAWPDYPG